MAGKYFITATDTGAGKTVATAAIGLAMQGEGLSVAPFKPLASGAVRRGRQWASPDALFLKKALKSPLEAGQISPVLYRAPLAPSAAARREKKRWRLSDIRRRLESLRDSHDRVLVEGIGGLLVPLKNGYLAADLAKDLELPLLVVSRPGLGTLNHTLLTVETALNRGLKVLGVLISSMPERRNQDLAEKTNIAELKRFLPVPFLGWIPRLRGVDTEKGRLGNLDRRAARHLKLDKLIKGRH